MVIVELLSNEGVVMLIFPLHVRGWHGVYVSQGLALLLHDAVNEEEAIVMHLLIRGIRDGVESVLKSMSEVVADGVLKVKPQLQGIHRGTVKEDGDKEPPELAPSLHC